MNVHVCRALAFVLLASTPFSQNFTLNPPLARADFDGDAREVLVDPTGAWFAYRGDPGMRLHLWVGPLDGGSEPVLASQGIPGGAEVLDYRFTADGSRLVYRAPISSGVERLYSFLSDGSEARSTISSGFPAFTRVSAVGVTPDSQSVVFGASGQTANFFEVYAAPSDGSTNPVLLTGPTFPLVTDFAISPDSQRIVYARQPSGFELSSVPLDLSSPSVSLIGPYAGTSNLVTYEISPDSTQVLFTTDKDVAGRFEPYAVPIVGGTPVRLAPGLDPNQNVLGLGFDASSTRTVLLGNLDGPFIDELYSVPVDGSLPPLRLTTSVSVDGIAQQDVQLSGSRIVYSSEGAVLGGDELYSVPIDGSAAPVQLNAGGSVRDFQVSPDGLRVVYRADQDVLGVDELYSIAIDGSGTRSKLNHPLTMDSSIDGFRISSDSAFVGYTASTALLDPLELFASPITGGPGVKVSGASPWGASVEQFAFGVGRCAYLSNELREDVSEILGAPSDGSVPAQRLSLPFPLGEEEGEVNSFDVSLPLNRVIYTAPGTSTGTDELYSVVPTPDNTIAERLNPAIDDPQQDIFSAQVSHDGQYVVYSGDTEIPGQTELFVISLAGGQPPIKLNDALPPTADVLGFVVSDRLPIVQYISNRDGVAKLFVVPLLGGAIPVEVDEALTNSSFGTLLQDDQRILYRGATGLSVSPIDGSSAPIFFQTTDGFFPSEWQVSDDSQWIVLRAATLPSGQVLQVAPLDGSQPTSILTPPLANGSVRDFAITPDSSHVVFIAAVLGVNVFEVFRMPIDGSGPAVRVSDDLVMGGEAITLDVGPNSQYVVYRADALVDGQFELFRASLFGPEPVVRISVPLLLAGSDVNQGFRATETGDVVYIANPDGRRRLYSVPIDGSLPSRELNAPLGTERVVTSYELRAECPGAVFYLEDGLVGTDGLVRLFRVPIDGSEPARAFCQPGHAATFDFEVLAGGRSIAYLGDPEGDGRLELLMGFLEPAYRQVGRDVPQAGGRRGL